MFGGGCFQYIGRGICGLKRMQLGRGSFCHPCPNTSQEVGQISIHFNEHLPRMDTREYRGLSRKIVLGPSSTLVYFLRPREFDDRSPH